MRPRLKREDTQNTLAGRLAAAFGSLFVSVPLSLLLWFVLNKRLSLLHQPTLAMDPFAWAVISFSVFAFIFPRAIPALLGGILEIVFGNTRN